MTVLAAAPSSAWVQPGTLGFLVVFGLGVILFFVFRSMSKHLKKVNAAAAVEAKQQAAAGVGGATNTDAGGTAATNGISNVDGSADAGARSSPRTNGQR